MGGKGFQGLIKWWQSLPPSLSLNLIHGTHTEHGTRWKERTSSWELSSDLRICTHRETQDTCRHVPFSACMLWHMHTHRETHVCMHVPFSVWTLAYAHTERHSTHACMCLFLHARCGICAHPHTHTAHKLAHAFSFKEGKSFMHTEDPPCRVCLQVSRAVSLIDLTDWDSKWPGRSWVTLHQRTPCAQCLLLWSTQGPPEDYSTFVITWLGLV